MFINVIIQLKNSKNIYEFIYKSSIQVPCAFYFQQICTNIS